ncbi:protein RIC-3b isoform X2 [Myripristis murdjan]|nr:protein RIC-3-like isoform X2 [Myripristis murdjan]XP_029909756.1 protein RIC-3-like isoform X2 [Myripristis murdjan]
MLLSRGKKDAERPEGPGHFPPMIHRHTAPDGQRPTGSHFSRAHNPEAIARAKGAGTGAGTGGKSNLAGQIIPIYGFGILLYILYILFKITSKGSSKPTEGRFASVRSENMKRKITDFELAQLQEKLKETELVMENIVSSASHSPDRVKGVTADQEESLLQQLREITRVMQEGRLVDGIAPENKAQGVWEGHHGEPAQYWEHSYCPYHHNQQSGPQAETETERTEADGAELAENIPNDRGEAEESEDLNKDQVREDVFTATGEEDTGPGGNLDKNDKDLYEPEEGGGGIDLGVPEEDLAGVLKELELTLKMTSMMEQEKIQDLVEPEEMKTVCSQVRRRNKRRKAKRDTQ